MKVVNCITVIFFACYAIAIRAETFFEHSQNIYESPTKFTDDTHKTLTLKDFSAQTNVITFAYANCRKVCVESLQVLERLQSEADNNNITVNFIVVSFDPLNDTPETWTEYRNHHQLNRTNWHFLTGSVEGTQQLARSLGIDYWLYDEHVMHDFKLILINSEGGISKIMDWTNRHDHWFLKD